MSGMPELADVKASLQSGAPEIQVVYDRERLSRYGLNIYAVARMVRDKVQGYEATRFNMLDRRVPIIVRLDEATAGDGGWMSPGWWSILEGSGPFPWARWPKFGSGEGPSEVRRVDGRRVALVRANLGEGSLSGAVQSIRRELDQQISWPDDMTYYISGQNEEWERSKGSLYLALGLSIFLVYVIMAIQFESLLHPFVIMFSIPLAFVGTIIVIKLLGIAASVVVFLGMIMLAGIVVNNAIVFVDYINQLRRRGMSREEAIVQGGSVRLRPILMTTATTVLGLLPMALGVGDGSEIRTPMAIAVISGLLELDLLDPAGDPQYLRRTGFALCPSQHGRRASHDFPRSQYFSGKESGMSKDQSSGESRLARFSLDRRITIAVLLATVVVVGVVAATSIPVELFPHGYTEPFLTVFTPWRDSPPREVLEKITEPLEEELSTVRGIDGVFSRSGVGRSRIWLRFKQGTDMDLAYREVRDRVERARRGFPDDADKVYIFKHDSAGIPVYVMGVAVDPSVSDTYNLIQKQIVMRLERVEGVANVEVNGLQEKEILIELDRDRTEASGLNIYDMAQELGSDSFTMASGHVREGDKKLLLRSVARYDDIEALRKRPVAPGIKLEDIAKVSYEEPEKRFRVRAMSMPAYALVIFKEGDANAREVCRRIDEVYAGFEAEPRLSSALFLEIFDQGDVIDETLTTLLQSGAIGGTIAGLVLFFFLRRFRQTVVVNLAIPLSLLISLTVMYFSGLTVNIISMLALMVCVGLLVDNSVVVAENIDRMYRAGLSRRQAAVRGASEIGVAITLSTLTTVVVFLPVALVEGPAQFFLLRMAVPISVALLASLVVALVCIPLGVYLTLPKDRERSLEAVEHPRPSVSRVWELSFTKRWYWLGHWRPWRPYLTLLQEYRRTENGQRPTGWPRSILWVAYELSFGLMNQVYNRVLATALSQRLEMVIILLLIFAATMGAMKARDLRFVDVQENESRGFEIDVEMPSSFTLEETEEWFLAAEKVVEDNAEELGLEGWFLWHMKTFGELEGWFSTPNTSGLTGREVTERVVEMLPKRPGIVLHTGEESQVDEGDAETTYQLRINGEDIELLDQVAEQLEELFVMVPGVLGIQRGDEQEPNEMALVVDRERVPEVRHQSHGGGGSGGVRTARTGLARVPRRGPRGSGSGPLPGEGPGGPGLARELPGADAERRFAADLGRDIGSDAGYTQLDLPAGQADVAQHHARPEGRPGRGDA